MRALFGRVVLVSILVLISKNVYSLVGYRDQEKGKMFCAFKENNHLNYCMMLMKENCYSVFVYNNSRMKNVVLKYAV
jgi:hypothetical protein